MVDLRELKHRCQRHGRLVIARVFLNQFAPEKLIEAIINEGFESVMFFAEQEEDASDVDVNLAASAMEVLLTKDVDVIALATRDADFLPIVLKAKEYGKKVIVLGAEPGFSTAIRNAADVVENL
jgi:uncharacterized protein (TIGR00288 family)